MNEARSDLLSGFCVSPLSLCVAVALVSVVTSPVLMQFQSCCIINNQKNTGVMCNGEIKRDVYVCMIEVSSFCVCFHAF